MDENLASSKREARDGMRIDWDVPIPMDDGIVLRADLFRPDDEGKHPVILSYGAFGKGLAFQEGNKSAWERMIAAFPEVAKGSTCRYQVWEVVDPEKWVPDGYACLRIDARGAGRSPGFLDPWSPRETQDIYQSIEWAAAQPWCNGKVGMNGISYFASNQWYVAQHRPPHLAAICVWEGAADWYREFARHGGIYCGFLANLYPRAFHRVQHGLGERGLRSRVTGELVSGPPTLSEERARRAIGATSSVSCSIIRSRTPHPRAHARFRQDHAAAAQRRQLGRAGAASARQFRRFFRCGLRAEMARGRTATRTGRTSTPITACACRSASSGISSRARTPAGRRNRGSSCKSAIPARNSSSGTRTNGRSRARNGPSSISIRAT